MAPAFSKKLIKKISDDFIKKFELQFNKPNGCYEDSIYYAFSEIEKIKGVVEEDDFTKNRDNSFLIHHAQQMGIFKRIIRVKTCA